MLLMFKYALSVSGSEKWPFYVSPYFCILNRVLPILIGRKHTLQLCGTAQAFAASGCDL